MRTRRELASEALALLAKYAAGAAWLTLEDGEPLVRTDAGLWPSGPVEALARGVRSRLHAEGLAEHEARHVLPTGTFHLRARRLSWSRTLGVLIRDDAFRPIVDRLFDHLTGALADAPAPPSVHRPPGGAPPSGAPALLAVRLRPN